MTDCVERKYSRTLLTYTMGRRRRETALQRHRGANNDDKTTACSLNSVRYDLSHKSSPEEGRDPQVEMDRSNHIWLNKLCITHRDLRAENVVLNNTKLLT